MEISEESVVKDNSSRTTSLSSAFRMMSLVSADALVEEDEEHAHLPKTPCLKHSHLPVATPRKVSPQLTTFPEMPKLCPPPLPKSPTKSRPASPIKEGARFLQKDSNIPAIEWEGTTIDKRLESMESMLSTFRDTMGGTTFERKGLMDVIELLKAKSIFTPPE
jgi:hypothetical protein